MTSFLPYDKNNKMTNMLVYYYSFGIALLLLGGALSVPNLILAGFIMLALTFCVNMMVPTGELTYEQEYGHFPKSRGSSLSQEELAVP
jgi:fatty acid desaturase